MMKCCLNPNCNTPYQRFGTGEVYAVERRGRGDTEFYWMCASCLPQLGVALSKEGVPQVVSRREQPHLPPPNAGVDLRVAFGAHV